MKRSAFTLCGIAAAFAVMSTPRAATSGSPGQKVDFDRDVMPIFSKNCFACHGPDANSRMANLRIDTEEFALKPLTSKRMALVPGKPDASELIQRIAATDATRMPPTGSGKSLTPAQVDLLRKWVSEGARFAPHWAFPSGWG